MCGTWHCPLITCDWSCTFPTTGGKSPSKNIGWMLMNPNDCSKSSCVVAHKPINRVTCFCIFCRSFPHHTFLKKSQNQNHKSLNKRYFFSSFPFKKFEDSVPPNKNGEKKDTNLQTNSWICWSLYSVLFRSTLIQTCSGIAFHQRFPKSASWKIAKISIFCFFVRIVHFRFFCLSGILGKDANRIKWVYPSSGVPFSTKGYR